METCVYRDILIYLLLFYSKYQTSASPLCYNKLTIS